MSRPPLLAAALTIVPLSASAAAQSFPHTSYSAPQKAPLRPSLPCQPSFVTLELPRATQCVDYSAALAASGGGGGPYTYELTSGALPLGLALLPNGVVTGIPSAATAAVVSVAVTGASGCSREADFVLAVTLGQRAPLEQVGLSIPPVGTGGSGDESQDTTVSTIIVSNMSPLVAVTGIDVRVTLLHGRVGDLKLTLVSPAGARIPLASHRGGTGANMLGACFSDGADDPVCLGAAPFSGSYRPERAIGRHLPNGAWTLEIEDSVVGRIGRLVDWSLDFETASFEPLVAGAARIFEMTLPVAPSALQGMTATDDTIYLSSGTTVMALSRTAPVADWTRDFSFVNPQHPLFVERSFGSTPCLVTAANGIVYGLRVTDGATLWSRDTRRLPCPADTVTAAPLVQLWDLSNCEFQTAQTGDLVLVGTHFMCGTTTANRVVAINAADASIAWTHNATGAYQIGPVSGLALDYARNQLYATADDTGSTQQTLIAIDTTTGQRNWALYLGRIDAPPIAATDCAYVVTRTAVVYKLDPDSGATIWSLALPTSGALCETPVAFHESRRMLAVRASNGVGYGVRDDGASGALAWASSITANAYTCVTAAPSLDKVYFGTASRRVYQLDIATGANPRFAFINPLPGSTTHLLIDDVQDRGLVESRLLAIAGSRLSRLRIGWTGLPSVDHGALTGEAAEIPVSPSVDLSIAGSTTPPFPSVGQNVVDTVTVTTNMNRVPDCVVVQSTVPAGMSFVSAAASQGSISLQGNQIVARLGQVGAHQSASIQVTLKLDVPGSFPRTYDASSEAADPVSSNDMVTLAN